MLFPFLSCGFLKRIQYKHSCRPALPMMALTDTKKNRWPSGNEYLFNIWLCLLYMHLKLGNRAHSHFFHLMPYSFRAVKRRLGKFKTRPIETGPYSCRLQALDYGLTCLRVKLTAPAIAQLQRDTNLLSPFAASGGFPALSVCSIQYRHL